MNIKQLFNDDRAVSPVIGVILMVAITVILAAVIGTFVLGLGDQLSHSSPTASFGFDYEQNTDTGVANDFGNVTISHNGGDKVEASNINVTASTDVGFWNSTDGFYSEANDSISFADMGESGQVGAGTTVTIAGSDGSTATATPPIGQANDELRSATVRIVWSTPNSDTTSQLGKWDGPDA